ncbi:nucleotidyltransferase domain-containing protein [Bacillus sp. FJAT-27445]|uniref:nucleotidyltransferase domain-containing protein n=1 Tax=Bacillus sp. FJAT-27445 TaxID=1679166 RepID=UPI00074337F3|nr:nucleotidyltransferase domain-containing protein [Bacillus sp. FJAT-27445]
MYGLLEKDLDYIDRALSSFSEIDTAYIFGSRAMGNYKRGSDVDIAISGKGVTEKTLFQVYDLLNEEYPLPYFFDVVIYEDIKNEELKRHIDTVGKKIYQRENQTNRSKSPI